MVMMTREPDAPTGDLLQYFLSLDTPEGYRAELIGGQIVMTPPPDGNHGRGIMRIVKQVFRNSAVEMDFDGHRGLAVPAPGFPHGARVIPDIVFAPTELDLFLNAPSWMEPAGVEMVVEVTSSRPDPDRTEKRHVYASAEIPLYLLIDRDFRQVKLFSHPKDDDYTATNVVAFGDTIELPDPFKFALDTTPFAD